MDVPEEVILCNKITQIQRPYARRFICLKKGVKKEYIKELEYQIAYHKLVQKWNILKIIKLFSHKKLLSELDKEKTKAMVRAESKCRKY